MTDAAFTVLHHLVVKGLAAEAALGASCGLDGDTIAAVLDHLTDAGLATERQGRIAGYSPTSAGRDAHHGRLQHDELRRRADDLAEWYRRFESVNGRFKELCTAWQLRERPDGPVPNDHADVAYDRAILESLRALHGEVTALLDEPAHPRIDRYTERLAAALAAVDDGDHRRFTAPLCESYHDIWMELHHDLLLSFGRARTAADA